MTMDVEKLTLNEQHAIMVFQTVRFYTNIPANYQLEDISFEVSEKDPLLGFYRIEYQDLDLKENRKATIPAIGGLPQMPLWTGDQWAIRSGDDFLSFAIKPQEEKQ